MEITYKATDFGRCCKLNELEAEGGKLFQEEFLFAADKTVSSLVNHLKGSQSI